MSTRNSNNRAAGLIILILLLGGVSLGVVNNNEPFAKSQMNGEQLWEKIKVTENYTQWKEWPGKDGIYEGQSPHGAYLKLFVNNTAYQALKNGNKKTPHNALIVKENYNKEKELVAITPMYKIKGYNPGAGDWFWAKFSPEGEVIAEGKVNSCISCHAQKKESDYLFTKIE